MVLYEQLKLDASFVAPAERAQYYHDTIARGPVAGMEWMYYASVPWEAGLAAIAHYLAGNVDECREFARRSVAGVTEYFFGRWRQVALADSGRPDPDSWLEMSWLDSFRLGVTWASCLGDWDAARRMSEYVVAVPKESVSDRKPDEPWYRTLAAYLLRRDAPSKYHRELPAEAEDDAELDDDDDLGEFERLVVAGKAKRHKLLCDALRCVAAGDQRSFDASWDAYLRYYRQSEFPRHGLDDKLCLDGSVLCSIAGRKGLRVDVKPSLGLYLVIL